MDLIEREKILLDYAADYIYEHESKLEIKYWKMGVYGKSPEPPKPFRRTYKSLNELMGFIDFIDDHVQGSPKIPEYRRFDYDFIDHIKTLVENFKHERKDAILNSTTAPGNTESGADKPPEVGMGAREETAFIKHIKGAGQIEEDVSENGKYNLFGKAEDFVHWFIYTNYEVSESFSFLPGYMDKYLNHGCTIETLKRYVRAYKKTVPGQLETEKSMKFLEKMHNPHKSGINPA
jgi:hypothetical protein